MALSDLLGSLRIAGPSPAPPPAAAAEETDVHPSNAALPPTLVVIPTYDEREALPGTLRRLRAAVPEADVLVVDDSSPDGTGEWRESTIAAQDPAVHVLHRAGNQGLGPAYLAGFAWGLERGYQQLAEMDADSSHRPEQLPRLLEAVRRGADLAIGSRWVPRGAVHNWPLHRLLLSRSARPVTWARCWGSVSLMRRPATGSSVPSCSADRRGHRVPGLLLPDRYDPPGPGPGRRDRRGPDRFR